jgi:hypothetical protein
MANKKTKSVVLDDSNDDSATPNFEAVELEVTSTPSDKNSEAIAKEHMEAMEKSDAEKKHDEEIGEKKEKLGEKSLDKREEELSKEGKIKVRLGRLGRTFADCIQWVYDQYHFKDAPNTTLNDLLSEEELEEEHRHLDTAFSEMIDNRLKIYSQYGDFINIGGEVLISLGTRVSRAAKRKNKSRYEQGGASFGGKGNTGNTQFGDTDLSMSGEEARKLLGR